MTKTYALVIIVGINFCLIACNKDHIDQGTGVCSDRIELEDIKPQGQSLSWIHYNKDVTQKFIDSTGQISDAFIINDLNYGLKSYQVVHVPCVSNLTESIQVSYNIMRHFTRMVNLASNQAAFHIFEFEISCLFNPAKPLENQRLDVLSIYQISPGLLNSEIRSEILTIPLMENPYSIFSFEYDYVPELILFNKIFQKVYSNRTWGLNQWKIYFSKDLGVVAFRNEQGFLWVLDIK